MSAIVRGDALRLPFGDATVDLIVTSPPYFALRSYQDGGEHYDGQIGSEPSPRAFLEALWAVTTECWRVLKPSGSLFVNLGDKYAGGGGHNNGNLKSNASSTLTGSRRKIEASADDMKVAATRRSTPDRYTQASGGIRTKSLMGLPWRYAIGCIDGEADPEGKGWVLRSEIVWSKPNGLPESVKDRVRRSHEQWFHLTKNGTYYADMNPIREPHMHDSRGLTWDQRKAHGVRADLPQVYARSSDVVGVDNAKASHPIGKLPDSVWTIPTQPLIVPDDLGVDHFAAFPTEWPRRIIAAWSPPGICTVCGEGRTTTTTTTTTLTGGADRVSSVPGQPDGRVGARKANSHKVTGEACACADTTAPTRPAVVLDPFGGTGTTAMVARALGRYGVSVDLSADYLRLANWRIFHSDGADRVRAKHEGRDYKATPVDPDQLSLLDLEPTS